MCIVIDINVLPCVFHENSAYHAQYESVKKWIVDGKGFVVYGGSKYGEELKRATTYHALLLELRRKQKVKIVNREMVDKHQQIVKRLLNGKQCNDAHLIAIFRVSGCRLLCSNDKRSDTFIKDRRYYLNNQKPPKIYRNQASKHLLCAKYLVQIRNVT